MIEEFIERKCSSALESLLGRKSIMVHELAAFLSPAALAWCKAEALERVVQEWKTTNLTSQTISPSAQGNRIVRGTVKSVLPFVVFEGGTLEKTVRDAVQFEGRYVCRPRRTLTGQVFRGSTSVSVDILEIRLSAATEYRYLPSLLMRALRGTDTITLPRFQNAIDMIDDAAIRQHDPDEFARLMAPMARWFAQPGDQGHTVPVEAILAFLEDKDKTVLRDYIKSIARIRSKTALDFAEIATLVRDLQVSETAILTPTPLPESIPQIDTFETPQLPGEELPPAVPPATGSQQENALEESLPPATTATESETSVPPAEEEQLATVPVTLEVEKQRSPDEPDVVEQFPEGFEAGGPPPTVEAEPIEEVHSDIPAIPPTDVQLTGGPTIEQETTTDSPAPAVEDEERPSATEASGEKSPIFDLPPAEETISEAGESIPPAEQEDQAPHADQPEEVLLPEPIAAQPPTIVESLSFPPDLRTSLANSLFHGNAAYFDATVQEVNRLSTWREAAVYLSDLLEINRLNPYAADVMQFTDTIRRWFVREDEEQAE